MATITQTYNLDIVPNAVPLVVDAHQSDASQRQISFVLYSSNGELTIPSGATAYFEGLKPDNNVFSVAATLSGTTVTVSLMEQITALAGDIPCQIKVVAGGAPIIAANFILRVQQDVTVNADTSETVIPGLVQQAQEYAQQAQQAAENIDETWFTNGVSSTQIAGYSTTAKTTQGAINELDGDVRTLTRAVTPVGAGGQTAGTNVTLNRANVYNVGLMTFCNGALTVGSALSTGNVLASGFPLADVDVDLGLIGSNTAVRVRLISGQLIAQQSIVTGAYYFNFAYVAQG